MMLFVFLQGSIPNQDYARNPTSSEFLVSIHFGWVPFQEFKLRIEHMNLTVLSLKVGK